MKYLSQKKKHNLVLLKSNQSFEFFYVPSVLLYTLYKQSQ